MNTTPLRKMQGEGTTSPSVRVKPAAGVRLATEIAGRAASVWIMLTKLWEWESAGEAAVRGETNSSEIRRAEGEVLKDREGRRAQVQGRATKRGACSAWRRDRASIVVEACWCARSKANPEREAGRSFAIDLSPLSPGLAKTPLNFDAALSSHSSRLAASHSLQTPPTPQIDNGR